MKILFLLFVLFPSISFAAPIPTGPSGVPISPGGSGGSGSGTVSSGTANRSAIYSAAGTTVAASAIMTDNGTNIGISSVNPTQALDVNGGVNAQFFTGTGSGVSYTQGNLGVGTSTTTNVLTVAGTAEVTGFKLTTTPTSGYVLTTNSVGVGTWAVASSGGANPAGSATELQYRSNGTTLGAVLGSGVDSNGNVGIGSITPGQKLDIQGTVRITGTGNVGINSLSPGQQLDVVGTIRSSLGFNTVGIGTSVPQQLCRKANGDFGYFNGAWASTCN